MPSKYKSKLAKPVFKQDATLPYKRHWKPSHKKEICTNCGYERFCNTLQTVKCSCGGTYQKLNE